MALQYVIDGFVKGMQKLIEDNTRLMDQCAELLKENNQLKATARLQPSAEEVRVIADLRTVFVNALKNAKEKHKSFVCFDSLFETLINELDQAKGFQWVRVFKKHEPVLREVVYNPCADGGLDEMMNAIANANTFLNMDPFLVFNSNHPFDGYRKK
jgi:hypothetical protein